MDELRFWLEGYVAVCLTLAVYAFNVLLIDTYWPLDENIWSRLAILFIFAISSAVFIAWLLVAVSSTEE